MLEMLYSVIDTKDGKLVANIPSQGNKPHPGRGVNVDHPNIWSHYGHQDTLVQMI